MSERILITGGAGFIGRHLARTLARKGYRVRILDNFSPQVHSANTESDLKHFFDEPLEILRGDVRSRDDLKFALRNIDAVFHFAASVGVGQSMYEIYSYTENNNLGTANLLQLLTENPVRKLIVASSMSLYGEGLYRSVNGRVFTDVSRTAENIRQRNWEVYSADGERLIPIPTPETKPPDLASIYALNKFDQERMCLLIGKAYKIPTIALRFFNVYGQEQSLSNPYTGVMAIFASRLLNGNRPLIFEDGHQRRDFVHVSDIVQACVLALKNSEADGEVFNIGSGVSVNIREVAVRIAKALGREDLQPEITGRFRVGDIRNCFADISKAERVLGYRPRVNLQDGIADLTKWLVRQVAIDATLKAHEELKLKGLAL